MISLEIFPGLWWRQIDTSDLPQDGQRMITEIERRFENWFVNSTALDFNRIAPEILHQWRQNALKCLAFGMIPLHNELNIKVTEVTQKHFLRDGDKIVAYLQAVNAEPHEWDNQRQDLLCGVDDD